MKLCCVCEGHVVFSKTTEWFSVSRKKREGLGRVQTPNGVSLSLCSEFLCFEDDMADKEEISDDVPNSIWKKWNSKGIFGRKCWSAHSWLFCLLASFLSVLATALFFQGHLASLQRDFATLKGDFSNFKVQLEHSATKNLQKRNSPGELVRTVSDVQVAELHGALPILHVRKEGRIGPWRLTATDATFVQLRDETEVEILEKGIYFIYAQIYYLTMEPSNSFQILTHNGTEDRKSHRCVATCSAQGKNSLGEISCYTGVTGSFESGQRLYLNQIEQNRHIHFRNGCSHFGIVLLKRNAQLEP